MKDNELKDKILKHMSIQKDGTLYKATDLRNEMGLKVQQHDHVVVSLEEMEVDGYVKSFDPGDIYEITSIGRNFINDEGGYSAEVKDKAKRNAIEEKKEKLQKEKEDAQEQRAIRAEKSAEREEKRAIAAEAREQRGEKIRNFLGFIAAVEFLVLLFTVIIPWLQGLSDK